MSKAELELGAGIRLALSQDGQSITAHYVPPTDKAPITDAWVRQALAAAGYGAWAVLADGVARLLTAYNLGTAAGQEDVARRVDAQCTVQLARDHMSASVTTTRAMGGAPLTRDRILRALRDAGITHGVIEEEIEAVLGRPEVSGHVVARGLPPRAGEDARFEPLVHADGEHAPLRREDGTVDYRATTLIPIVEAGQALMRRIPPTSGKAGHDVLGRVLPARGGRDRSFSGNLKGTRIDPGKPDLLVADWPGIPRFSAAGVTVEPSLMLDAVDLTTGNIRFDGSITVRGDIVSGMRVELTGDLAVHGVIEAADVSAGGNVVVNGGIIGQDVEAGAAETLAADAYTIRAGGLVQARHVENARIEARDIEIQDSVAHSMLRASGTITVGRGTRKGHLIGGTAHAVSGIRVAVLGSPNASHTHVVVGLPAAVYERPEAIAGELAERREEFDKFMLLMTSVEQQPEAVRRTLLARGEATMAEMEAQITALEQELAAVNAQISEANQKTIVVERRVYAGVMVVLGGRRYRVVHDAGPGSFRIDPAEPATVTYAPPEPAPRA